MLERIRHVLKCNEVSSALAIGKCLCQILADCQNIIKRYRRQTRAAYQLDISASATETGAVIKRLLAHNID